MKRTHNCGELNRKHIGKEVVLNGWIHRRRDHGSLIFVDLRDRFGIAQVVFNAKVSREAYEKARGLGKEFVVGVKGKVARRPRGTENPKLSTGEIELVCRELTIFNEAKQPLPLEVSSKLVAGEETRLRHRYLDLRRERMQRNIALRHRVVKAIRDFFDSKGFLEIETPILAKSTPEGARDYLVPSRVHRGKFFALPQSPQLFKQILMVSGFERYFQIAKCFRDEDLRADRQPEFTQLDLEMSFVNEEDIFSIVEGCLAFVLKKVKGVRIKTPFPRLSYDEAMNRFGSDKPDTRFKLELCDVTECFKETRFGAFREIIDSGGVVKALRVPMGAKRLSKSQINKLSETAKVYGAKGLVSANVLSGKAIDSMISKHLGKDEIKGLLKKAKAKQHDLLFMVAANWLTACTALGQIRLQVAELLNMMPSNAFNFLWVTDFPMFEWDEGEHRLKAMHHPFTSPKEDDLSLLEKDPLKVKSRAYDVVLNGVELGGGSIRIHKRRVQDKVFKALGINESEAKQKFGFLLEAFSYGAPPHGGIALGLDRFVMILAEEDSIRDVIAFPKNKVCVSPMDDAPSPVSEAQLKELGLKIEEE